MLFASVEWGSGSVEKIFRIEDKLEYSNAIKALRLLFAEGFDCSCLHSSDFGGASLKTFAAPTNGGGVAKRELLVPRPLRAGHTLPRPQQNL